MTRNLSKILIIGAFLFAQTASAHSLGASLEKIEGEYKIDIGVSEMVIRAGETVRFGFELYSATDGSDIGYDEVWVLIRSKDDRTLFSGNINRPESGLLPTMSYVFPEKGSYEFTARYVMDNKKLVEATFEMTVEKNEDEQPYAQPLMYGLIGLALGLAVTAGTLIKRKNGK
jgi:hypothetical protein